MNAVKFFIISNRFNLMILFEKIDAVGKITLNRPEKYNSFVREMAILLQEKLAEYANDDSIRTIQLIISTLSDAVIEARNKKEEDVENKDMETELSPAEDEKPKMKKEESSEDSISEVSAEAKTSKVEFADENIEKTAKKERAKKPSIKTKAEKEPVSNIEEQVESKKKDDSPIESENEEN